MKDEHRCLEVARQSATGFVLVEVMVAVVIFGIVLVPLAAGLQRAMDAGSALRGKAGGLCEGVPVDAGAEAWAWGPMVESAGWKQGPELQIGVRAGSSVGLTVGMWIGGWLLGEWPVPGDRQLKVATSAWAEATGEELVIRVREPDGRWGPPWRCIVPNAYGDIVGEPALAASEVGATQQSQEERTVVRVRSFSAPLLSASWTDAPLSETALGLVYLLPSCGPGYCQVELSGEAQAWYAADGRSLDVYF
jgi:hypothetical protein